MPTFPRKGGAQLGDETEAGGVRAETIDVFYAKIVSGTTGVEEEGSGYLGYRQEISPERLDSCC